MDTRNTLVFFVNGKKIEIDRPSPETTLLGFLRQTLYMTGTKSACGQGACGACTVMISSYDVSTKSVTHVSVNACLVPLCYLHGRAVTTVEGIGSSRTGLHAVQKNIGESHAFQCGFCTPGMAMTMYTLLRNNPNPTQEQMERVLEGNLCRCTGYRSIVDAFVGASKDCPCGLGLCQQTAETSESVPEPTPPQEQSSQDVIFPPELQLTDSYHTDDVVFRGDRYTWYRPTTLAGILRLKANHQGAPVVMGCNSIGYVLRKGTLTSDVIICGSNVKELAGVVTTQTGVRVGAGVTMAMFERALNDLSSKVKGSANRSVVSTLNVLRWIGVDQIRNTATIGGHVMSHAPNLDLQAFLMAAGAELEFSSQDKGTRQCKMDGDFVSTGYSQVGGDEILVSITIPFTKENEFILGMKQPHRRGFDYGIVTCGMFVELDSDRQAVQTMRLAFGGIDNKKPVLVVSCAKNAVGKAWSEDLVTQVCGDLIMELNNGHYDNAKFRLTLACSFFYKFFMFVQEQLKSADSAHLSGTTELPYSAVSGTQVYDVPDDDGHRIVWKPLPNVSADYVTTGEAQFVDDIPACQSELFAVPVTSTHAHARIVSVDTSRALALPGVVDYIASSDVPGKNKFGEIVPDGTLFAEGEVFCYGQVIGAILAESRDIGAKATQLVAVTYEKMDAVFTIEEAIEKNSFFEGVHKIEVGDLEGIRKTAQCVEGSCSTGIQEHLYIETQSALAVPKLEQHEMEVFSATQMLTSAQHIVSEFLNIPRNRVAVKIKRVGGAFGGKQGDAIAVAGIASVGAWKTKRPVRCVWDRATDVHITGKRHPAKTIYKAYFNDDGRILGLDVKFYINAGYTQDASPYVVKIAFWFLSGSYNIPNIKGEGHMCKTNLPSNTAFRGFGAPQMLFAVEHIVQHVASHLGMPPEQVRQTNLIRQGSMTVSRQVVSDDNLMRCWTECLADSQYDQRKQEVAEYNRSNRWRKRGMALIPIMFGVGYAPLVANQAGALVLVYLDGSVLLTHGGVEMGQGLHTKMIQVAATELDIPKEKIIISEVSTGTVPNTTESGGTQVADLNAGAIQNACVKIRHRLEPFKKANPKGTWTDWVNAAYEQRVSLSATGFFKSRVEGYDFDTNTGVHANYFTYGVACTEVEIDCLTGEHQVPRVDIVMDVGKSLNPTIDVGQIEGGYVMGYGLMTMEQIQLTAEGRMKASGPLEYKIPTVRNIPRQFNIKLLQNSETVKTVYSSKGVGEPPLLLASSAFFAIKEAVQAARAHAGLTDDYPLKCPATVERIRMACKDKISDKCELAEMKPSSSPLISI